MSQLLIEYDTESDLKCGNCGHTDEWLQFDIGGACPDNCFCNNCNNCNTEIEEHARRCLETAKQQLDHLETRGVPDYHDSSLSYGH